MYDEATAIETGSDVMDDDAMTTRSGCHVQSTRYMDKNLNCKTNETGMPTSHTLYHLYTGSLTT